MEFTKEELKAIKAVFDSIIDYFEYEEINKFMGSVTINDMLKLHNKIDWSDYCERRGIRYENITDEDIENRYRESEQW